VAAGWVGAARDATCNMPASPRSHAATQRRPAGGRRRSCTTTDDGHALPASGESARCMLPPVVVLAIFAPLAATLIIGLLGAAAMRENRTSNPETAAIQRQSQSQQGAEGGMSTSGSSSSHWNVYVLSAALVVLFAGYNTSQELGPKLLGRGSRIATAVFYATATIAGPLPARIAAAMGQRTALVLSALCYALYVASLAYLVLPVVVCLSVVLGVAAAVLFTVLPAEINSSVSPEHRGWANSLTWASLRLSAIPGNLLALSLLKDGDDDGSTSTADDKLHLFVGWSTHSPVFIGLAALCCAGALVLMLVRPRTSGAPAAAVADGINACARWQSLVLVAG
jgi:hypothetical protein